MNPFVRTKTCSCRAAWVGLVLSAVLASAACASPTHLEGRTTYRAPHADTVPVIDGDASDAAWDSASWQDIKYRWLGPEYTAADFTGRYKMVWTNERIHILVEIVDDILIDTHRDPLVQYWDDD